MVEVTVVGGGLVVVVLVVLLVVVLVVVLVLCAVFDEPLPVEGSVVIDGLDGRWSSVNGAAAAPTAKTGPKMTSGI